MDTIVGRGGNQAVNLAQAGVAPAHCMISMVEGGYNVYPLNVAPTYVDGKRQFEMDDLYSGDTPITVGNYTTTVEELYKQADFSGTIDWGVLAVRMPDYTTARVFNELTIAQYLGNEQEASFIADNVAACQAYYLIAEGKLRQAQELLYEAGDSLYEAQDGSERLTTAYAALLIVLGWLYVKAGRTDVAAQAVSGARQLIGAGAKCSETVLNLLKSLE